MAIEDLNNLLQLPGVSFRSYSCCIGVTYWIVGLRALVQGRGSLVNLLYHRSKIASHLVELGTKILSQLIRPLPLLVRSL